VLDIDVVDKRGSKQRKDIEYDCG